MLARHPLSAASREKCLAMPGPVRGTPCPPRHRVDEVVGGVDALHAAPAAGRSRLGRRHDFNAGVARPRPPVELARLRVGTGPVAGLEPSDKPAPDVAGRTGHRHAPRFVEPGRQVLRPGAVGDAAQRRPTRSPHRQTVPRRPSGLGSNFPGAGSSVQDGGWCAASSSSSHTRWSRSMISHGSETRHGSLVTPTPTSLRIVRTSCSTFSDANQPRVGRARGWGLGLYRRATRLSRLEMKRKRLAMVRDKIGRLRSKPICGHRCRRRGR